MSTSALAKRNDFFPSFIDEFIKPFNGWFDGDRTSKLTVPAVNVEEREEDYLINLAAPGMKKDDFHIDVNGRLLTISAETETKHEEKEKNYTRQEYNYSSFSRSFMLPVEVNGDKIEAAYDNGVLKLTLPKKEEAKKLTATKTIAVK